MKDIAITIVNYKMVEDIRELLYSLEKDLTGSNLKIQVAVIDNTPADGAWLMLKNNFPEVRYLPQDENLGFGRAQNVGLKAVEAKYYFILNPDTIFPPSERVIPRLYDFLETHPAIGMIGPKLLNTDGGLQYSCYRFPSFFIPLYRRSALGQRPGNKKRIDEYLMKDFSHEEARPVDWLMGSAMFARGQALKEAGFFDERYFMYFEDCDLCRRFWEAHWPVYYVPQIKITHRHGKGSAIVPGFWKSMLKNSLTRAHIASWLKYVWKWRGLNT
ncbi:MAG: glycosyltransferase family 2 protein [Candidatus Magasanikbacteria bacterium]|nr:glycosyltransferase family 2 protein [Candidatus Magasanikbacteria bacterium]